MYQVAFQNIILCTMALSRQNFIHPDSQSLRALLHTWDSALPTTPKTADSESPFLDQFKLPMKTRQQLSFVQMTLEQQVCDMVGAGAAIYPGN
ncbi:hypothetical protein ACRRTK_001371 [Alexandromys fortis]